MDIDFKWGGDPSIILGVEAALIASIPIQVNYIKKFGLFTFEDFSFCIMYLRLLI